MAREFAPIIKEFVSSATAPLLQRIATLEAQQVSGQKILSELSGRTVKSEQVLILELVRPALDGAIAEVKDGIAISQSAFEREIESVSSRLSVIESHEPQRGERVKQSLIDSDGILFLTLSNGETQRVGPVVGRAGVNGKDGRDGIQGPHGEVGPSGERGVDAPAPTDEQIAAAVTKHLLANPPPRGEPGPAGKEGSPGGQGPKGDPGKDGEPIKGDPGKEGRGIAELFIDVDGNLKSTFTDGAAKTVGKVVGKDGVNGADGRAGNNADPSEIASIKAQISEHECRLYDIAASSAGADSESILKAFREGASESARIATETVHAAFKDHAPATDDLERRLAALEAREPEPGTPGERGADAPEPTETQLAAVVAKHLAANPPAKGEPGLPGEPGERGPQGEKGEAGADGERGPEGAHGPRGEAGKDAQAPTEEQIDESVAKYIAANPPSDGKDGQSIQGGDGRGITEALIDSDGALVIVYTDGATKSVGRVRGADGKDGAFVAGPAGKDGTDGLGVDNLEVTYDGERTFQFHWANGKRAEERKFVAPMVIDRGVYKAENGYQKGDAVTFGGNIWIAQRDTKAKPDTTGPEDWRLGVKKGRDGRDGKDGKDGERGLPGKDFTRS